MSLQVGVTTTPEYSPSSPCQESIYHAVPILGLPLTQEQNMNAGIVKQKEIGTVLSYKELDEEALESAITQLLDNQKVKANVDGMSALVKDSRTNPLEVSMNNRITNV